MQIADLVGDMVGDCVGSSADIFESIAAEIIGAMILAGSLATEARLPPLRHSLWAATMRARSIRAAIRSPFFATCSC